eukprot:1219541-Ditylum_brightwellii.AAC.1
MSYTNSSIARPTSAACLTSCMNSSVQSLAPPRQICDHSISIMSPDNIPTLPLCMHIHCLQGGKRTRTMISQ